VVVVRVGKQHGAEQEHERRRRIERHRPGGIEGVEGAQL